MADARPAPAKAHFHLGLLAAFAPGFGALLTVALAFAHRRSADPWARRIAVLAAVDVLVVLALVTLAAGGGLRRLPSAAPRTPLVGVQLDEKEPQVLAVAPGSPAEQGGIRPGDRLLRIDGHPVNLTAEAIDRLRSLQAGKEARLAVRRDGEERELAVLPRPGPWTTRGLREVSPQAGGPSIGPWDLLPFLLAGALAAWTAFRGGSSPPAWPAFFLTYVGALAAAGGTAWLLARLQGGASLGATLLALGLQSAAFAGGAALAQRLRPYAAPPPADPMPSGRAILLGAYYLATLLPRAAILVALLLSLPIESVPRPQDPIGLLASGGLSPAGLALLAVDVVLLAPIAEEMLFRGYLLPRLAARMGPQPALLATALLFAALHTHYGLQALVLVVHGVVLGWARLRTGRLAAPVLLHMAVNGLALGASLL